MKWETMQVENWRAILKHVANRFGQLNEEIKNGADMIHYKTIWFACVCVYAKYKSMVNVGTNDTEIS